MGLLKKGMSIPYPLVKRLAWLDLVAGGVAKLYGTLTMTHMDGYLAQTEALVETLVMK